MEEPLIRGGGTKFKGRDKRALESIPILERCALVRCALNNLMSITLTLWDLEVGSGYFLLPVDGNGCCTSSNGGVEGASMIYEMSLRAVYRLSPGQRTVISSYLFGPRTWHPKIVALRFQPTFPHRIGRISNE